MADVYPLLAKAVDACGGNPHLYGVFVSIHERSPVYVSLLLQILKDLNMDGLGLNVKQISVFLWGLYIADPSIEHFCGSLYELHQSPRVGDGLSPYARNIGICQPTKDEQEYIRDMLTDQDVHEQHQANKKKPQRVAVEA